MADLVGFSLSQTIPKGSLLRLTFGERSDMLGAFGIDPFGLWPLHMGQVWSKLPTTAHLYPSTPANVSPSSVTATIDARSQADRLGSEIIGAIESIDDNFVQLKRAELLTPVQVAAANSNVGATARDAAAATAAAEAAADSPLAKLVTAFKLGTHTVEIVAGFIVLVLLLLAFIKAKR